MWYAEVSPKALQDLALQGKISNRIISWRLMLRVLQGTHEEIISQSWLQRENYYGLKEKLEPKASNELDANVFNPLSVSAQVRFN